MRVLSLALLAAGAGLSISQALRQPLPAATPVGDAFAYITDMKHWPEYWPDFARIQEDADARRGKVGERVTIVPKLLRRERALDMKLEEFRKDERVSYVSRQQAKFGVTLLLELLA